jgi:hypothetical protein
MKKRSLILLVLALLNVVLLQRCKKDCPDLPVNHIPKGQLLKEWRLTSPKMPTYTYLFYYNKKDAVDSIHVSMGDNYTFSYRVQRKSNGQINTVIAIENSVEISNHVYIIANNYKYNRNGLITHYDYHAYDHFGNHFLQLINIVYEGAKMSIKYNTIVHEFTFDNRSDIVHMKNNTTRPFDGTFDYDNSINPLFYVKDFYAILLDMSPYYYEYMLPKHNAIRRTYEDGYHVDYTNTYDNKGRLVGKDFTDTRMFGAQSFFYSYY